jgi:hypothetical protein
MITVALRGGLGNQLFQYALGRSLELERGDEVRFDPHGVEEDQLREYRLDKFRTCAILATTAEVRRARGVDRPRLFRVASGMAARFRPYHRRRVVVERGYGFDPRIRRVPRSCLLRGYWQDERYFRGIRNTLLDELTPRDDPGPRARALMARMDATTSVSVHVRRGDYVWKASAARTHGVCPPRYYERAAALLLDRVPGAHFFVFSDDVDWAREHLQLGAETIFVDGGGPERDYEDLQLMRSCRHHIVANSSFSWWGAWLCRRPDPLIVAPDPWFNEPGRRLDHPAPAKWLRLSTEAPAAVGMAARKGS